MYISSELKFKMMNYLIEWKIYGMATTLQKIIKKYIYLIEL